MGPWNSDAAPGRALRAVHEHDALVKEGVADFVGAGEVLRLLGLAAFLDQGVDAGLFSRLQNYLMQCIPSKI